MDNASLEIRIGDKTKKGINYWGGEVWSLCKANVVTIEVKFGKETHKYRLEGLTDREHGLSLVSYGIVTLK